MTGPTTKEIFELAMKWKAYAEEGDRIIEELRSLLEVIEQAADMPSDLYDEVKSALTKSPRVH
jgi:phosphoglycolate phosphatase-like HAD superfamily hydrolase